MPVYRFEFTNSSEREPSEYVELADHAAARQEASRLAGEHLIEQSRQQPHSEGWFIQVFDEANRLVWTVQGATIDDDGGSSGKPSGERA